MRLPKNLAMMVDRVLCSAGALGVRAYHRGHNPFLVPMTGCDPAPYVTAALRGTLMAALAQAPCEPTPVFHSKNRNGRSRCERYRFHSGHQPLAPALENPDVWEDQREARGLAFRSGGARGALIFLHGWAAPFLPIYDQALGLRRVCARNGLDLFFPRHPYHAEREPRDSRFPGSHYLNRDLVRMIEAFRMSLHELRGLWRYCRARYRRVAIAGVSLGGWTCLLASCFEPDLDCVVAVIPLVAVADVFLPCRFRGMRRALERAPDRLDGHSLRALALALDLRRLQPATEVDRLLLLPARGDTHIPEANSHSLVERWGLPHAFFLPSGHLTFPWAAELGERFWSFVLERCH